MSQCCPTDMQRFQVPYHLKAIPEVQDYLKDAFEQSKNRTDLQDLYRRRYSRLTMSFSQQLIVLSY